MNITHVRYVHGSMGIERETDESTTICGVIFPEAQRWIEMEFLIALQFNGESSRAFTLLAPLRHQQHKHWSIIIH